MIRLYLDWNVFNQMKNNSHSELRTILESDQRFIKYYSTAHIGDIYSSYSEDENQQKLINEDLRFITRITDNNCIYNGKENQAIFDVRFPHDLLEDRVESEKLIKNFNFDSFSHFFDEIEINDIWKKDLQQLKDLPTGLDFSNETKESMETLRSMFPDLKEKPNFGDFFQSYLKMIDRLNNDTGYDYLRKTFQNGLKINRDKIFDSKNPIEYFEKQLKQVYEGGLNELVAKTNELRNNKNPSWFETITNTFINLDMAGFQEDKVQIKQRNKQTFKNTTEDSFHSAFASTCDIYILNDKKGYKKTLEVYNHLKINTKVFKPNEFVEYYDRCLKFDNGQFFLNMVAAHIKETEPYVFEKEEHNSVQLFYYSDFYFFNYFNRIIAFNSCENEDDFMLLLSKDKPTNGRFILKKEVESLIEDLIRYFGNDENQKGLFTDEEFLKFEKWEGRTWILEHYHLRLIQLNGYLQLYIDII